METMATRCLRSAAVVYLFDRLQQRRQPVLVDLAVTVQEGEDSGPRSISTAHSGPDQT